MARKRNRAKVVLYDHSTTRNRATASTFDFDFTRGRLVLDERIVEVTPKVDNPPPHEFDPAYAVAANEVEEIRDDEVGVTVKATTRAKRYLNSVSCVISSLTSC